MALIYSFRSWVSKPHLEWTTASFLSYWKISIRSLSLDILLFLFYSQIFSCSKSTHIFLRFPMLEFDTRRTIKIVNEYLFHAVKDQWRWFKMRWTKEKRNNVVILSLMLIHIIINYMTPFPKAIKISLIMYKFSKRW